DDRIRIWDTTTFESVVFGNHFRVEHLALSHDGKYLASGGANRRLVVWDLKRKEVVFEGEQSGCIRCIAFADDDALIATGDNDGIVKLFDFRRKEIKAEFKHENYITSVLFVPKSRYLLCATGTWPAWDDSVDATLHFWDYKNREFVQKMAGNCFNIRSMCYEAGKIVAGAENGAVSIWSEKKKK